MSKLSLHFIWAVLIATLLPGFGQSLLAQTRSTYAFELNALKDKYNVLNHHNPFSVINDDRSREWRQVSLIPIMPCFSYRIQF